MNEKTQIALLPVNLKDNSILNAFKYLFSNMKSYFYLKKEWDHLIGEAPNRFEYEKDDENFEADSKIYKYIKKSALEKNPELDNISFYKGEVNAYRKSWQSILSNYTKRDLIPELKYYFSNLEQSTGTILFEPISNSLNVPNWTFELIEYNELFDKHIQPTDGFSFKSKVFDGEYSGIRKNPYLVNKFTKITTLDSKLIENFFSDIAFPVISFFGDNAENSVKKFNQNFYNETTRRVPFNELCPLLYTIFEDYDVKNYEYKTSGNLDLGKLGILSNFPD